jgi:GNAT superfamily N-acetyltransferase
MRLFDADEPVECLVAEAEGRLVGMVQYLPHADTWDDRPICYLSDLFVHPSIRGEGIGALLIRSVEQRSLDQGWSSVYWQTAEDNEQARVLYDKITGGVSRFIIYELGLEKPV